MYTTAGNFDGFDFRWWAISLDFVSNFVTDHAKNLTVSVLTVVATNSDPTVEQQVSRKQRDGQRVVLSQ